MIVATDYKDMARLAAKHTYQETFKLDIKCHKCDKSAGIIMIVDDTDKVIASQRPKVVKIWPHDSMAIALYLCDSCGEMSAEWNQA